MSKWLDQDLNTVATFWRLYRRDGITLGLTGHDRDLLFDGIVHRAAPGMLPSAIELDDSLNTDTMDVSGALSHNMISEGDLQAGRWDGAQLVMGVTDWTAPQSGHYMIAHGELGSVEYDETGFRVELASAKSRLDAPVAPRTSPTCRAHFGAAGCGINLHRFTREGTVSRVTESGVEFAGLTAADAAKYVFGSLRWIDGGNAGLKSAIWRTDDETLMLSAQFHAPVSTGDRAYLYEGCDKRLETCRTRFNNVINYQGEPYLPGNDLLTRYPGG